MLYGSQKRFDKNGDGKLKGAEWQRWYQYAYGDEIEAKEKRRRANTAEQKRAQIAADFADHVSDLINWMYRDLAHLEGEREDQAIRTMHLALYVISAALQTQKVDESMRYLLRAFWNEFQPTLDESVYQALCAKQVLFAEIGEISEKRLGSFWGNLLDNLPPERRVGKDDDLQELLDDTNRLYNYFCDDSAPEIAEIPLITLCTNSTIFSAVSARPIAPITPITISLFSIKKDTTFDIASKKLWTYPTMVSMSMPAVASKIACIMPFMPSCTAVSTGCTRSESSAAFFVNSSCALLASTMSLLLLYHASPTSLRP